MSGRAARRGAALLLALLLTAAGCASRTGREDAARATYAIDDAQLPATPAFIVYGDMRFTAASETDASWPAVRQALVAQIAREQPAAVFLTGDVPWHGGTVADYDVFRTETTAWRTGQLRVYPALGNHEFAGCAEAQCLENWWSAFPDLRGRRWYSVALGRRIRAYALDSEASLLAGSEQRLWLERQLAALPPSVRFVLVWLHHPPVAALATGAMASHNPRPNEVALADYLRVAARSSRARFLVVAGHIHNYERYEQDGIAYLVSGGGGAKPVEVARGADDRYQAAPGPTFHYVRCRLEDPRLACEMVRVDDPTAARPERFEVRDRFELRAR